MLASYFYDACNISMILTKSEAMFGENTYNIVKVPFVNGISQPVLLPQIIRR